MSQKNGYKKWIKKMQSILKQYYFNIGEKEQYLNIFFMNYGFKTYITSLIAKNFRELLFLHFLE